MSDLETAGNLANLALCFVSALAWCALVYREFRWPTSAVPIPRARAPWSSWSIALAFPVSVIVQAVVFDSTPGIKSISLDAVKRACLTNVLEAVVLMGLLALGTQIRAVDFGLNRGTTVRDVMTGLVGFLASWLPVFLYNQSVYNAGYRGEGEVHPFFKILEASPGWATIGWMTVAAVFLAPLTEELLYRVIIQGWLETRLSPRIAIFFVSAWFAAIHSQDGRPDAIPLFPLALILGYVYYRRHSLLASFTMHAAFNAANLALALMTNQPGDTH